MHSLKISTQPLPDLGRSSQKEMDHNPVFLVKAATWQESDVPVLLTV